MPNILKWLVLLLVIFGLLYWFYERGGPQPVTTVEEPVAAPASGGEG